MSLQDQIQEVPMPPEGVKVTPESSDLEQQISAVSYPSDLINWATLWDKHHHFVRITGRKNSVTLFMNSRNDDRNPGKQVLFVNFLNRKSPDSADLLIETSVNGKGFSFLGLVREGTTTLLHRRDCPPQIPTSLQTQTAEWFLRVIKDSLPIEAHINVEILAW